jgi:hypothetical protein
VQLDAVDLDVLRAGHRVRLSGRAACTGRRTRR